MAVGLVIEVEPGDERVEDGAEVKVTPCAKVR